MFTVIVTFIIDNIVTFIWDGTIVVGVSGGTITPSIIGTDSLSITITSGITSVVTLFIIPFINIVTFINRTFWVSITFVLIVQEFNVQIRETPRFVIGTLINGRVHIKHGSSTVMVNNHINIIEVISPIVSTLVSNIGVLPSRHLFIYSGSV